MKFVAKCSAFVNFACQGHVKVCNPIPLRNSTTLSSIHLISFVVISGDITLGGNNIIDPTELRNRILSQNLSLTSDVVDWLINATLNRRVGQML